MAGHNKWSKIKHKKGHADAKRSKVWTKLIREITVAAKLGGTDPGGNARLRKALDDARGSNVPKDTIERALKRVDEGSDADSVEELVYEGYGTGGVALLIECMTDNRNRTGGDVRSILKKNGGSLGTSGSVAYLFDQKGHLIFDKAVTESAVPSEDALMEIGLEHGAEDVSEDEDGFTVLCAPADFQTLREAFAAANFVPSVAEVAQLPQTTVSLAGDDAKSVLKLVDALEDHDDVQHVWSNFDIDADELEKLLS